MTAVLARKDKLPSIDAKASAEMSVERIPATRVLRAPRSRGVKLSQRRCNGSSAMRQSPADVTTRCAHRGPGSVARLASRKGGPQPPYWTASKNPQPGRTVMSDNEKLLAG